MYFSHFWQLHGQTRYTILLGNINEVDFAMNRILKQCGTF